MCRPEHCGCFSSSTKAKAQRSKFQQAGPRLDRPAAAYLHLRRVPEKNVCAEIHSCFNSNVGAKACFIEAFEHVPLLGQRHCLGGRTHGSLRTELSLFHSPKGKASVENKRVSTTTSACRCPAVAAITPDLPDVKKQWNQRIISTHVEPVEHRQTAFNHSLTTDKRTSLRPL